MNPYDDRTGRARPSQPTWHDDDPSGDYPNDDHHGGGYPSGGYSGGGYPGGESYAAETGSAGSPGGPVVGRASVGRASVPPPVSMPRTPSHGDPYAPPTVAHGRDPYASAPYGDPPPISPVGPSGYPGGPPPYGPPAPVSSGVVGRAAVRPGAPGGNGGVPGGPGGRGPGGRGPGGRGPGGPGGRGPFGRGDDGSEGDDGERRRGANDPKRAKKARLRNILIASFAVFIMLTGAGVVGGTYYVDSVPTPSELDLPESTTVLYADGKTVMARLGNENRTLLAFADMNNAVKDAIVAAEDQTFWTNEGVDFKGVMRAAWNNFTGGDTQGASTIAQQYARAAMDLQGSTYSRKLREAVMAWKLSDEYTKEEILEFYLNTVPFGRGAYGIEAAAQAYFGKTASNKAKPELQVTVSEAAVLVANVKQPEADPTDPVGAPGYDPKRSKDPKANEKALELSKERWEYVIGALVKLGKLTEAQAVTLAYPLQAIKPYVPATAGLEKPSGLAVQHALSELAQSPVFKGKGGAGNDWNYIRNGGFKIVTTIDARAQKAAETAADITAAGAPAKLRGQKSTWQAALVAVEPGTGRVLAYFGGKNGAGADFAGWFVDEANQAVGFGAHPPGSTFKVYDLAAALKRGISLSSYWDAPRKPKEFEEADRVKGKLGPIRNASTASCQPACTLIQSAVASLNIPFFDLTLNLGAANVLEVARDAGLDYMWEPKGRQKLADADIPATMVPNHFGAELGIGQYGVTVLDHANGMATFAAGGNRADAHFVKLVTKNGKPIYGETINPRGIGLNEAQVRDLNNALREVSTSRFGGGWHAASKTGTWEWKPTDADKNSHVWTVGYTKAIAAAVWVGTKDGSALRDKSGSWSVFGGSHAGPIWQQFMRDAHEAMKFDPDKYRFEGAAGTGDTQPPGSIPSPTPPPQETQDPNQTTDPDPSKSPGPGGGPRRGPTTPPTRQ